MSEDSEKIQCPCGRIIDDPKDYKVLYLKRELKEVDILCPNDSCYLRELGYVKFDIKEGKAKFKEASFYPPFVTWNAGRITENVDNFLKDHLIKVAKKLDWKKLAQEK